MLFCCLWHNVQTTLSLFPAINELGCSPATSVINLHGPSQLSVLHLLLEWFAARSEARYWLRIAISPYLPYLHLPFLLGGSRRNIAMPFGVVKLEWCGYPMVKKF